MKIKNLTQKFTINVDIAESIWKRMKGLSFSKRRNLFFVFDIEREWEIWMFGMKFPINIVYVNSKKVVVDVKEAQPLKFFKPETWSIYKPFKPCKYILETTDKRFNIGDKLFWV